MSKQCSHLKLAPLAAALLLAFGGVHAQQSAEVTEMSSPDRGQISTGVGATNGAANVRRLGQYTGLNKDGALLLDIEMVKRDEATGTWTQLLGRDLGLDTRELGFTQQRQGDWKYEINWNEIVRNDPYVINTGMTGLGTTTPTINLIKTPSMPAAWATANGLVASNGLEGHDEQLKLKRTALGFGGDKWITSALQLEVNFRDEEKKGARMFGRVGINSSDMLNVPLIGAGAANGNWALLLTPEPIDSSIKTIETKLNYSFDKLAISGGYYGSFYTNNNGTLTPVAPASLNRGALWTGGVGASTIQQILSSAVALPPDNQAHQLYMSGTYAYSDTVRTNFKLSYTHATQDESFTAVGLSPSATAPASLGGVVDTTLLQLGLTARPVKNLSISSSLRFEDRQDKTPVYVYNYGKVGGSLDNTTNWPSGSQRRTSAKFDGIYRLPDGYSATAGLDWEHKVTPLPPTGTAIFNNQVAFRESMDESGLRLGLRKAMSETVNGALGLEYKQRRSGDSWMTGSLTPTGALVVVNPATANIVLADMYMDRDRTKARGSLDWAASEAFNVQLVAEHGQDDYLRDFPAVEGQLVPINAGARKMVNDSLTIDANYKFSDNWNVTGYWTRSENRWNVNKASLGDDTFNNTDTVGVTVKGQVSGKLSVGFDVAATDDVTRFNNVVATGNVGGVGNIVGWTGQTLPGNYLPNIHYNTLRVNLFSTYQVDKKSAVRLNVAYQEFKTDDWQWGYNGVPFLYSDNTTVSNPNQAASFVGLTYIAKF